MWQSRETPPAQQHFHLISSPLDDQMANVSGEKMKFLAAAIADNSINIKKIYFCFFEMIRPIV
jgi:hypothetical protein